MVKDNNNEPLRGIADTSMEIIKKKKKKKKRSEEQNLVPSIIDPSLLVPVAKDHRVNLDGVLDEDRQSKIDEWMDNDIALSGGELTLHSAAMDDDTVLSEVVATLKGGKAAGVEGNVAAAQLQVHDILPSKFQVGGQGIPCPNPNIVAVLAERVHTKSVRKRVGTLKWPLNPKNRMNNPLKSSSFRTPLDRGNSGKHAIAACSTEIPALQPVGGTVHAVCTEAITVSADCPPAATVAASKTATDRATDPRK